MKLYTEEQVLRVLNMVSKLYKPLTVNQTIEHLTPIELPSDEEIEEHIEKSNSSLEFDTGFKYGVVWMRDKIQGGNK